MKLDCFCKSENEYKVQLKALSYTSHLYLIYLLSPNQSEDLI